MKKDKVMYLDIDDTMLIDELVGRKTVIKKFAPGTVEFLNWASEHFEIRWLTFWCMNGTMAIPAAKELSEISGFKLPFTFFTNIKNDLSFNFDKCDAIDFKDPRPFVWVEDQIQPFEYNGLKQRGKEHCHYPCNSSRNPYALIVASSKIAKDFNLPRPNFDVEKLMKKELDNGEFRERMGWI